MQTPALATWNPGRKAEMQKKEMKPGRKTALPPSLKHYGGQVGGQFLLSAGADVEKSDGASLALPPSPKRLWRDESAFAKAIRDKQPPRGFISATC